MKKILFFVLLAAAVLAPLSVSAEYMSYNDILTDVQTIVGESPDLLWEKNAEEAKAIVEALESGYKCGDLEDDVITCSLSHWSGRYQIRLHFTEDKLDYTDFKLTSDGLKDLNYKRNGITEVVQAKDFYYRMDRAGLFNYIYTHEKFRAMYFIFPDKDTSPETPAIQADEHSFMQVGYNVLSETNSEFSLELVYTSETYATENGMMDPPAE